MPGQAATFIKRYKREEYIHISAQNTRRDLSRRDQPLIQSQDKLPSGTPRVVDAVPPTIRNATLEVCTDCLSCSPASSPFHIFLGFTQRLCPFYQFCVQSYSSMTFVMECTIRQIINHVKSFVVCCPANDGRQRFCCLGLLLWMQLSFLQFSLTHGLTFASFYTEHLRVYELILQSMIVSFPCSRRVSSWNFAGLYSESCQNVSYLVLLTTYFFTKDTYPCHKRAANKLAAT